MLMFLPVILIFAVSINVSSLPSDKILALSKLEAFAVDKNITKKLKFVSRRIEDIEEKGDNAGYQHFLLFPQQFLRASFSGSSSISPLASMFL